MSKKTEKLRPVVDKKTRDEVNRICNIVAQNTNIEFVEATWEREPRGIVLTAFIDKLEGVSLDDCELFHKALQVKVEKYDYDYLEVSSLGADRPIKNRKDFERFAGEMVEAKLYAKVNGSKIIKGNIVDYNENFVTINVQNNNIEIEMKDIAIIKPVIDVEAEVQALDLN
ncbi:MAG: hypothetical protein GYA87_08915 [Christensenellaceae bacterium]|nr:hypothetical protein [Christensenellaceae bacterium]